MGSGGAFRICVFSMFCEKSVENLFGELRCAQEVSCEGVDEMCVKFGVEGVEPRWARYVLCCRGWRVANVSWMESCDGLALLLADPDSMAPTPS